MIDTIHFGSIPQYFDQRMDGTVILLGKKSKRRSLVMAVVGGLVLGSLLGAVWMFGSEEIGSASTGGEMTQSTGVTISTDDIDIVSYANLTDEPESLSNVAPGETDSSDVMSDDRHASNGFPSETDATVRTPPDTAVETVGNLGDADEDTDQRTIDSCTEIVESGRYELVGDVEGEAVGSAEEGDDACLRITASDVLLDGNDNTVVGAGDEETTGVLVASSEEIATENVTIRNLRVESWGTGIQIGIEYDHPSDARLENVIVNENGKTGIYVENSGGADIEGVEAHRNGGAGIGTGEEGDLDSLMDVTANENDVAGVALDHTSDLVAEEITVSENGGHGLLLGWRVYTSEFTDVTATNNAGDGLHLDTDVNSNEFSGIVSSGNAGHGIYLGIAGGNVFRDSTIESNGDVGVRHIEDGSEYVNVTIRDSEDWQVETNRWAPFTASELVIGDTAEFVIDAESVSLEDVDRDELEELPEDARPVGDGVEIGGIEDGVDASLEYDRDEADGQIELWRYDGDEWTSEETVGETDGSIESTLIEDGIYAPILIEEDSPEVDLDIAVDEQDVTVVNQHDTAVDVTATDDETDEERLIEVGVDETVTEEFESGDYTLRGEVEDERPVTLNGEEELSITVIAADPPAFAVSDLHPQNATISEGDEIDVSATIENVGGTTGTQTVEFTVSGHSATEVVDLGVNESMELSFTWTPSADDVGTHAITVATGNESSTTDLVVDGSADDAVDDEESESGGAEEESEDVADEGTDENTTADSSDDVADDEEADNETTGGEGANDEDVEGSADDVAVEDSPGFGISSALVGLGVTVYLLKRRLY